MDNQNQDLLICISRRNTMVDYNFTSSDNRSLSAQEVSLRARKLERQQALMTADFKAHAAATRKSNMAFHSVILRMLTGLRLF
jgi:hypothetical protein